MYPTEPLEPVGAAVGIDMGVTSFLTTATASMSPTGATSTTAAGRLTAAQRNLTRKTAP